MSNSITRAVTKKINVHTVTQERLYDHLYDPVYTVSSEVDHTRACVRANALNYRGFRKVPEFAQMFSDQSHYRVKMDPAYPVPSFSDYRHGGQAEQSNKALQQLAGVPKSQTLLKTKECHVTGADYWKYFKSPSIPFMHQFPPNVTFDLPREDFLTTDGEGPTHRNVGVQTDYRESETQTDPYSPEYVLQPGTTPSELLQLAALSWGRGLPAGLAEVEMIERARAKQAWEASLPPLNDLSQLHKRRRMMEEMEAKEWAFREQEIKELQDARLAVLKDLLMQRNEAQNEVTNQRLNRIYSKCQKDTETKLHKINNDYLRAVRKLEARRENVEGKLKRRDIVTDFCYLQTHKNVPSNRDKKKFELNYLDTYEDLEKLEASLKPWLTRPRPDHIKAVSKSSVNKAVEQLNKYKALLEEEKQLMTEKSLNILVKKEKLPPPPVIPRVEPPSEGDEQTELAVITLQKLLRGRSIQNEMFKGKENQMMLLLELRTTHALNSEEQELQKADKEFVMALKKQRDQHRQQIAQEEAAHAQVVGAELEQLFDTLSKELIRLQEERRIHAFALLAERERRRQEAEEGGRRQMEERRRKENDEIFRQVAQVHQESVDMFLEDIILENIGRVADEQAREELRMRAKQLNDVAYAMEERDSRQSEEIVSELVYSFLIPEIEKINVRQKVHLKQQKHLQAARSIIQETAATAGIHPQETSELTSSGVKSPDQAHKEMIGLAEQEKQTKHQHIQSE